MAVYTIFHHLGLPVSVQPFLELRHDERENLLEAQYYKSTGRDPDDDDILELFASGAVWIGDKLRPAVVTDTCYEDNLEALHELFPGHWLNVNWLTEGPAAANREFGFVHAAVGVAKATFTTCTC